jgi:drug/metabolite transporter (DMT)-like permease
MLLLVAGSLVLMLDQSRERTAHLPGLLAVLVATAAWGFDNTLSRSLAERDPAQVVVAKAALGTIGTSLLAVVFRRVAAYRFVGATLDGGGRDGGTA